MNVVKNQVHALVCAEATAASLDHGPLHSRHEAWAILKEEVEEAEEELKNVTVKLNHLWALVRVDQPLDCYAMTCLADHAIKLACEAIQCAAVCRRIVNMEKVVSDNAQKL